MTRAPDPPATRDTVRVLVPRPVAAPYDYLPPPGLDQPLVAGDYLRVPLRSAASIGVVWGPGSGTIAPERLRHATARVALPPMPAELRHFLDRASGYTLTPPGAMLALSLRPAWLHNPRHVVRQVQRAGPAPERMTAVRQRILAVLDAAAGGPLEITRIMQDAACSRGSVVGLLRSGTLVASGAAGAPGAGVLHAAPVQLSGAQGAAAAALVAAVEAEKFETFLLQGVTGSGKTEVYLEALEAVLERERQALVLLPEIALTAQFVRRLEKRFGFPPAVWHSRVGLAERRRIWRAVVQGEARVVAGARSALFLPFRDLGLIVVDEEHDSSYKQEDGVIYHARDMAVLRGQAAAVPVILATATPSLETYANVCRRRYRRLQLPERFGGAVLPEVRTLDLREHRTPPGRWIAPPLEAAMRSTLADDRQVLLFLNRRGYAPLMLCRACGFRLGCPDCDAWQVWHQRANRLSCHQCGRDEPLPGACPDCGEEGQLAACGPGVERLAEEVAEVFPEMRHTVLSSDTVGAGTALMEELETIRRGAVDIVVGTQVMAKGHDFPGIALVGVIDADLCLRSADLRAGERTFQIVRQVTGRAGRAGGDSRAYLQTADPDNPILQAIVAGDEEAFLARLAAERKEAGAPPFGRYVAVVVSGVDAAAVEATARQLAASAGVLAQAGIRLFGPAPAPFARLRARWRWRLLAVGDRNARMLRAVAAWRARVPPPRNVRIAIDVDPQSFL